MQGIAIIAMADIRNLDRIEKRGLQANSRKQAREDMNKIMY